MTLAMQWGYPPYTNIENLPLTQGFIYFDAVTMYKRTYTGSVSKHPIDGGGLVTDHFTRENPSITISAVISSVDISINGINIFDFDSNTPINQRVWRESVKNESDSKSLSNFLPNVVGQFFTPAKPKVTLAPQPVDTLEQIRDLLIGLFANNQVELVTLYEYTNSQLLNKPLTDLVLTSITFTEDPQTGEGLYCDLTFEQISFANTRSAKVPAGIRQALLDEKLSKLGAPLENEGKKDSTPQLLQRNASLAAQTGEGTFKILNKAVDAVFGGQ